MLGGLHHGVPILRPQAVPYPRGLKLCCHEWPGWGEGVR